MDVSTDISTASTGPRTATKTVLLRAAGTLWLPALLPFVFGPLRECGHCVQVYVTTLPVEPGFLLGALLQGEAPGLFVAAGVGTLLLFGVVFGLMRVAGRRWHLVALSFGALSGWHAITLSHLLRG